MKNFKLIFTKVLALFFLLIYFSANLLSQEVYVDSNTGIDSNNGTKEEPLKTIHKAIELVKNAGNNITTIKLNPGVHVLDSAITVQTDKEYQGEPQQIIIQASIMPDDSGWTPDSMPSIMYAGTKDSNGRAFALYINQSHVKIAGIRYLGFYNICTKYFPVFREDSTLYDLEVEQCMFVADPQVSVIHIAVFAHGDSTSVKNCIFYKANNATIFGLNSGNQPGNSVTSSIVFGAGESAVWTVDSDSAFVYKYNVVTDCNFFWVYNNDPVFTFSNCIVVNNNHIQGSNWGPSPVTPQLIENNVITEGQITLEQLSDVYGTWPKNHLHVSGYGSDLQAGLFVKEQTFFTSVESNSVSEKLVSVYPNPVKNTIYITAHSNVIINDYKVTSLMGKVVLEGSIASDNINVSSLNSGVYVLNLHTKNGENISETFVIQ